MKMTVNGVVFEDVKNIDIKLEVEGQEKCILAHDQFTAEKPPVNKDRIEGFKIRLEGGILQIERPFMDDDFLAAVWIDVEKNSQFLVNRHDPDFRLTGDFDESYGVCLKGDDSGKPGLLLKGGPE